MVELGNKLNTETKNKQKKETMATTEKKSEVMCKFVDEKEIAHGNWLALKEITYSDPTGKKRKWEAVTRVVNEKMSQEAVAVIAILKCTLKFDCIILVRQYRPPLQAYTIEFPAGLVDVSESPSEAALRELKEETGYTGILKHKSPAVGLDPGASNNVVTLVTVEIDGDQSYNRSPKPKLEPTEFIETKRVQLCDLLLQLNEFAADGDVIDSRVYSYAIALEQTKKKGAIV